MNCSHRALASRKVTVRELGEVGCGDLDISQATERRLEKCPAKWVVSKEVHAREPRQIDLGTSGNSSSKDADSLAFVLQMGLQAAYVSASFGRSYTFSRRNLSLACIASGSKWTRAPFSRRSLY